MREKATKTLGRGRRNADPASGDGAGPGEASCADTPAVAEITSATAKTTTIRALLMLPRAIPTDIIISKRKICKQQGGWRWGRIAKTAWFGLGWVGICRTPVEYIGIRSAVWGLLYSGTLLTWHDLNGALELDGMCRVRSPTAT